ncbi:MAG: P-loop NTPase [Rhodospirillales bacterium]|nr:P-loop NTPase [Rhodospirillales bacterium]
MLAKALGRPSRAKPFAAFVGDDDSRSAIAQVAEELGFPSPPIAPGGIADAVRRLANVATPQLLVVDLAGAGDPMAEVGALADVCDEGTQVLAIGDVNDIALYRTLLAFGIHDYLVKPINRTMLAESLTRAKDGPQPAEPVGETPGKVVAVVGARGGVGATTIAVNLAWMLAHEQGQRVALVDLDLFFGSCGLTLDLESGRGFREALENPSRIDGLFIERAMVRAGDNLFVLSAEEALDYVITFDPSAIELLIEHLRRDFQVVVVDLPRFGARTQTAILSPPCSIVLVSEPSLAGMRDTRRLVNLFANSAPKAEVSVVLNRVGANKGAEVSRGDFEAGAETKANFIVPFEPKTLATTTGTGKPLAKVAKGSKTTLTLRALSVEVAGEHKRRVKAPFWQQWLAFAVAAKG